MKSGTVKTGCFRLLDIFFGARYILLPISMIVSGCANSPYLSVSKEPDAKFVDYLTRPVMVLDPKVAITDIEGGKRIDAPPEFVSALREAVRLLEESNDQ